jgi:retron-type reverse transcriptase
VDFYALFDGFYKGQADLQSKNNSFITLVSKSSTPSGVNNFRPISLLGGPIKLITKLLAERLQKVITKLIHANQYGFIKERSIHDCLGWAFQYLYLCHGSKREIIILKLDFEKAFDKVEHHVILDMLQKKGLSAKWISSIRNILNSGTSQVLLNGVPEKIIHYRRGVRQGDLLSPLLFVLVADLL